MSATLEKKVENQLNQSQWLKEWFTPNESHSHRIDHYLVRKKTKYQDAIVADSSSFGRCLILDGEMQSSQFDEFIYHECLVHPALILKDEPKSVLIMGGGEGATTREILKHKSIEMVTMVDIDGEVIDFCTKHLKTWHQNSFASKKLRLIVDDAKKFVENTNEKFDVIISDLPSPIEAGPAYLLYTIEFYKTLVQRLSKDGLFVMQAGSGNLLQIELHQVLYATLKKIFKIVRPFYAYVPSFDVPWAFLIGSNQKDPMSLTAAQVDKLVRQRIKGSLQFYDGVTHVGLFHIPKNLRERLEAEKRVILASKPVYFYK